MFRGINSLQIGAKQWKYYDFGPKTVSPLVCIPGIAGNADVYYKQIMCLSMKVLMLIIYIHIYLYIVVFLLKKCH